MKVLPPLITDGNKNAISDVGVASLLASAACKGALFNVEINLNSIPEEMYRNEKQVPAIKDECSKFLGILWIWLKQICDYLTIEPVLISESIVKRSDIPLLSSAANIIPSEVIPRSGGLV